MKVISLLFICYSFSYNVQAQEMNNQKLNSIIYTISDEIDGGEGQWQFKIDSLVFICVTDELHNRMRIIAPIAEEAGVTQEQLRRCMQANFHSALDVKYCLSDGILWSAFIHPLQELTKDQVLSAISQVYSAALTFGTVYSSGSLSFPTQEERDAKNN